MRTIFSRTMTLGIVCLGAVWSVFAQVKTLDQIQYPPLAEFKIPQPARVTLDNGLVLLLLEDHELPLVNVSVRVHTGGRLEPADKVGLARLTGTVMRTGGTKNMTGDQLDDYLESKAASIETSIGTESGAASLSCLKKDFPETVKILSDVLRYPAFDQQKIEIAKNQVVAGISRQNDDPQNIMFREFDQIIYGESSPYARVPTYQTVGAVTREDMIEWHARYFHPDRALVGVVGDFDTAQTVELLRQVFGSWQKGPEVEKVDVPYQKEAPVGVFQVVKEDVNQANIIMGHLGIRRDNPDYYAVEILNQIFGGGFSSRLFSNVRSQKGLAYAVSGGVEAEWDHPGLFDMWLTTKTESTTPAIEALMEEARNLTAKPPTRDEIDKAKASILNSFIFNSDSMEKILGQQLTFEYYGYPADWLARYRAGIDKVSADQVRAAAEKYIHSKQFAILVVGPAAIAEQSLAAYGPVKKLDITIPEPSAPAAPAATTQTRERAAQLIAKAVEGLGGAQAVDSVRSIDETASVVAKTPGGEVELKIRLLVAFPDRMLQEIELPQGVVSTVVTADEAFMRGPGGARPLPDSMRTELKKEIDRNLFSLLQNRGAADLSASAVGSDQVGGLKVELVRIDRAGDTVTLGIDPESGRVLSMAYRGNDLTGARVDTVMTFSDFRKIDGLIMPFASSATFNGEPALSAKTEKLSFNVEVDAARFTKPQ